MRGLRRMNEKDQKNDEGNGAGNRKDKIPRGKFLSKMPERPDQNHREDEKNDRCERLEQDSIDAAEDRLSQTHAGRVGRANSRKQDGHPDNDNRYRDEGDARDDILPAKFGVKEAVNRKDNRQENELRAASRSERESADRKNEAGYLRRWNERAHRDQEKEKSKVEFLSVQSVE